MIGIKITYSWGDEEPLIPCSNDKEEAWKQMKELTMKEVEVCNEEEEREIGLVLNKEEGSIKLHYNYDDEWCYYNIVEAIKYYDVVCSIYEEYGSNDIRVDSHLLCGGFKTENEAMEYINTHDCSEYDKSCGKNKYSCIEIEEHNEDGSVSRVITVD